MVEEIDIFYAQKMNKDIFGEDRAPLKRDQIKDHVIRSVEVLENMRVETPQYSRAL
jgi:hypothetical protein